MNTLLLTRCYPYREEPEVQPLLESALRESDRVFVFPTEGIRKPLYREPLPALPEGAQVWNVPKVPILSAWRTRRTFSRAFRKQIGGFWAAHRVATILCGIRVIVHEAQEPMIARFAGGWDGALAGEEALRLGLLQAGPSR